MSDLHCPATILVVRHGESEGNVGRRLASVIPGEPLTERGRAQAGALAERLRNRKIAYVYTSPLLRARQTGQILAEAAGVRTATLDGLREFSMGRCEGSQAAEDWAHIDETFLHWLDGDLTATVEGGESGRDILQRMRDALQEIADQHRGETVIAVSHGGAMGLALPRLTDVAHDQVRAHPVPNCGLAELNVNAARWELLTWPGDPDRGPHPGDLVDLVGRANAEWFRSSGTEVHGIPCVSFAVNAPWATQATVTERADLPDPERLSRVRAWLDDRGRGSWRIRVRDTQVGEPALAGLVPCLRLGVWLADRRPSYTVPEGVEIGAARDPSEFLAVFGEPLASLLAHQFGEPGRTFLVLREHGETVGCARVTEVGGTAYISAITVSDGMRGRGLGRLMSAAATGYGLRHAGLAWLHCEDELGALYQQLGYRRITTHVDLEPRADSVY